VEALDISAAEDGRAPPATSPNANRIQETSTGTPKDKEERTDTTPICIYISLSHSLFPLSLSLIHTLFLPSPLSPPLSRYYLSLPFCQRCLTSGKQKIDTTNDSVALDVALLVSDYIKLLENCCFCF